MFLGQARNLQVNISFECGVEKWRGERNLSGLDEINRQVWGGPAFFGHKGVKSLEQINSGAQAQFGSILWHVFLQ